MDPNFDGQQWQQQYPNTNPQQQYLNPDPNPQYGQPLQQQFVGTPQQGYASATQQSPSEYPIVQQDIPQPSYQSLMQQMPTQQQLPDTQIQQQPSYQQYNQWIGTFAPTPSAAAGPRMQTQPDAQWQAATNSATTTTTTTTSTRTTKETQASQPQYSTSSTAMDFASLMQQPPQQPPQQQPSQQQHAYNYSQTTQNIQQQQAIQPPAPDFSQLMQNNPPQTQNAVDFSQLLQTSPPPQPQVSQAPPVLRMPVPQKPAQSSNHASSKSTNKTTNTSTTTVVGSTSRQKAAEKGKKELRRFDQDVSDRLKRSFDGICPMGFDYYAARQGYICGGGHHFFSHEDVEAMLKHERPPFLEHVNSLPPYDRLVTPPPGNGDGSGLEPLFMTTKQQGETGHYNYASLKDPMARWQYPIDPYKQAEFLRRLHDSRMRGSGFGV